MVSYGVYLVHFYFDHSGIKFNLMLKLMNGLVNFMIFQKALTTLMQITIEFIG